MLIKSSYCKLTLIANRFNILQKNKDSKKSRSVTDKVCCLLTSFYCVHMYLQIIILILTYLALQIRKIKAALQYAITEFTHTK